MEKILLKLYILPVPFQLTPARGRKRHQPSFARAHEISTHPREGTKTTEANIYLWTMPDFNSPPRGDENVVLTSRCLVDAISTHPREGTKTAEMIGELSGPNFNSPPRGDENHAASGSSPSSFIFQLTPARGRKLTMEQTTIEVTDFNSPPRGDENE